METLTYTAITKEIISSLSFNRKKQIHQKENVVQKLLSAAILGNVYHSKVTIFFHDDEGPKKVSTTIWAAGEKYIRLKGGTLLPVEKISDVEYNF